MHDRLDPVWDEIEKIERGLALAKRRNEPGAVRRARQAIEALDQAHPGVMMMRADLLTEEGQLDKAIEIYQEALKGESPDPEIENKLAAAVLKKSRTNDFGMAMSDYETIAEAKSNLVLSLVVPGLGQLVSGQTSKGAALMGGWLGCLLFAALIPGGFRGLLGLFGVQQTPFNPLILLPIFGMGLCFAISWGDMAGRAKQVVPSRKKPVEHPVPPVDKDFEMKL